AILRLRAVDEPKAGSILNTPKEVISSKPLNDSPSGTKLRSPGGAWKQLRCGSGYWDPKTTYMAKGKDPVSCHDEVE
ncbi:hypothetical protein LTR78_009442, partial [Recurvomyces mirabilis]